MDERRERDPDTGEDIYVQTGAGISDIFAKVAAKTAKKLAVKAAEKGVEKIGEKTGKLIGEKIYDKFSTKKVQPLEAKGEEIIALLRQEGTPKVDTEDPKVDTEDPKVDKYQYVKDVINELLK